MRLTYVPFLLFFGFLKHFFGQCKKLYFLDIVGLIDDWSKKSITLFSANKVNGDANGEMGDQDCPAGLVEH